MGKKPVLDIKRRDFIALGGSAGLLLAVKARRARAQQPAMPVLGFLYPVRLSQVPISWPHFEQA